MKQLLSKLSRLWESLSYDGKLASIYGFRRKLYPYYLEILEQDAQALADYLNIKDTEITPGEPDDGQIDPITDSLYFVGRVTLQVAPDVTARVFLKYPLRGDEEWWTNIRGPRGKMFDELFREYFDDNTAKIAR